MTESEVAASALAPPIPQDILDVFKLASEQEVKIVLADEKAANALRFKFHRTRKQMRRDKHYMLSTAEQVMFSVEKQDVTVGGHAFIQYSLIARPADLNYRDALAQVLAPHKARLEKERKSIEKKIQEDEEEWMRGETERLSKKHIEQRQVPMLDEMLKKGKKKS